jgi:N-methylhydantoinase B
MNEDIMAADVATVSGLDPVTVEVIRNKLDGIANEMQLTLIRSSFSTIVKEALDASASLFTVRGETLAQAVALPGHLCMLVPMLGKVLATYPVAEMHEGDLFILNDPYDGGSHLPDICVAMPVFAGGRTIAFSAALTHHQDVGGMTPASVPTNATEIFQEGIRVPLLKLRDAGAWNETLLAMLRKNVRIPDTFMGDLNAQVACCAIGARRLGELTQRHDPALLMAIFDDLLDRSERMTRAALRALPPGTYRYALHLDNDGVELDKPVRIAVAVTVGDGEIGFDFTGSSPQTRGPINAVPSGAYAAGCIAVRVLGDASIPNNGGAFRPLRFVLPQGSVMNPREPAPVGVRAITIKMATNAILGALRQAAPDRISAEPSAQLAVVHFGGIAADGEAFITTQLLAGGTGASPGMDGVDVMDTDSSNCGNVSAEALEMAAPLRVHSLRLARDSGGAGSSRGGLGCEQEFEMLADDITVTYRGERHHFQPAGADGGRDASSAMALLTRQGGAPEVMESKRVLTVHRGDRLTIRTAGGGGHGPAEQRDRAAVRADVADGKVSPDAAAALYGYREIAS